MRCTQIVPSRTALARPVSHVSRDVRDRRAGLRALTRVAMPGHLGAMTLDREPQLGLARVSSLRILLM
ncbi:MAG TPA: hypothetical protein VGC60_11560 [Pyrinomonadaceae bacterium]